VNTRCSGNSLSKANNKIVRFQVLTVVGMVGDEGDSRQVDHKKCIAVSNWRYTRNLKAPFLRVFNLVSYHLYVPNQKHWLTIGRKLGRSSPC
jgi:hypothetical protein